MSIYDEKIEIKSGGSAVLSSTKISPIVKARMGRYADLPALKLLMNRRATRTFGTDDILLMFEKSYITFVLENTEDDIVAAMFFNNYPNLPAIPPWDWVPWIRNIYHLVDMDSRNTLFVHLAVYNGRYTRCFFEPLIRQAFRKCLLIKYVIVIIPPQKKFLDFLCPKMSVVQPPGVRVPNPQKLVLYLRHDFMMSYKMRKAVIEDNDDLVPLIDMHSERLKNTYGSFYIAELISDEASKRHAVVCEYNGVAVGIILFNEDLNLDLVKGCFHLECFYGLRKHSSIDDIFMLKSVSALGLHDDDERKQHVVTRRGSCKSDNTDELDALVATKRNELPSVEKLEPSKSKGLEQRKHKISFSRNIDYRVEQMSRHSLCSGATLSSFDTSLCSEDSLIETFRGIIVAKFSCQQLSFTIAEIEKRQKVPTEEWMSSSILLGSNLAQLMANLHYYNGPLNAFTVEILAAWPPHEAGLVDLLTAGFELFPDRDYCVMCVPSKAPYFQILGKTFVRVSPLPMSIFPHELYLVHRNSLCCSVTVRKAQFHDKKRVGQLLETMRNGQTIYRRFLKYLDSETDTVQTYVVLADAEIVGVANLKDLENMSYILGRYQLSRMVDLSRHKPGCYGRIKHFALSPIFHRHARFLLLELHRLSDYSLLLYFVYPEETSVSFRHEPLNCVLNVFLPVVPAKVPEFKTTGKDGVGWAVPEIMQKIERPYAVYLSTPMYCGLPRYEVNTKIVVVGASEVGLSFLIELIFNKNPQLHTIFNNVTLVSTHGVAQQKSNRWQDIMLPMTTETTTGYYLSLISLVTYVNVVKGVMSGIDRKNKTITVNNASLPYDMLFLTCGTQFQIPIRPALQDDSGRYDISECPENVFVLNTQKDVNLAMQELKAISSNEKGCGKYIVYGNCIEAYCCIEGLLEFELRPSDILFVIPPYSEKSGVARAFTEPNIEQAVHDQIVSSGVTLYKNHTFCDWKFDVDQQKIKSITFETATRTYEIETRAAFMYQTKRISNRTFDAINRANLIFDGALVISPEFQTNDPNIYAAGRITKYSRRYYADHMRHLYFNQSEIGYRMALVILTKLLPMAPEPENFLFQECHDVEGKMLVPRYMKPVMLFAKVPQKIQYLYVKKPGKTGPMSVASLDDNFGQVLTTGDPHNLESQGYFLLHLNQYNSVETIIAINQNSTIERTNLTHLWGKHECLLNNLVVRYNMGLIKDLFTFFSQPWIYALFHDKYEVLERDLTKLLMQKSEEPGRSVIEDVVRKIQQNNMQMLTHLQQTQVNDKFTDSGYHKEMEEMVLDFLTDNYIDLPMYGTSMTLTMILGAYKESPLFTKL